MLGAVAQAKAKTAAATARLEELLQPAAAADRLGRSVGPLVLSLLCVLGVVVVF